jgi:hypothetical protein
VRVGDLAQLPCAGRKRPLELEPRRGRREQRAQPVNLDLAGIDRVVGVRVGADAQQVTIDLAQPDTVGLLVSRGRAAR